MPDDMSIHLSQVPALDTQTDGRTHRRICHNNTCSACSEVRCLQYVLVHDRTYKFVVEAIIVVLGILIHPDCGETNRIFLHHVYAGPPLIGASLAENVPDVRAQDYFQHSAAHPHLVVTNGNMEYNCENPRHCSSQQSNTSVQDCADAATLLHVSKYVIFCNFYYQCW